MIVNIRLNLNKELITLRLQYNTFEKVSYDKYFIATILSETRDLRKFNKLNNDLTGKGSLNHHFKKVYEEVKLLSKEEVEAIIKDSLYPITKVDETRFQYIPFLNISNFKNKIISGNLSNDDNFAKSLVDKNGTYVKHEYSEPVLIEKPDNYTVRLTENLIEIKINDDFYEISLENFQSIVNKEDFDLSEYKGIIHNSIDGKGWNQLTKLAFDNLIETKDYYYDNGNHIGIYNDNARTTKLAYSWGIYWINEKTHNYQASSSRDICEKASEVLMESGRINEIKNKTLLDIIKNISREKQQEIINYVLSKKDVKDLALNGLILIDKGYEKGWNTSSLESFLKFYETSKQLLSLYKVNNSLDYDINQLVSIYQLDKTVLSDNHEERVISYYEDIKQITNNINLKIGEIMLSGIRENIGKKKLSPKARELRKYINSIAHFKKDLKNRNLQQLIDFEKKLDENYVIFLEVKKELEEFKKSDK